MIFHTEQVLLHLFETINCHQFELSNKLCQQQWCISVPWRKEIKILFLDVISQEWAQICVLYFTFSLSSILLSVCCMSLNLWLSRESVPMSVPGKGSCSVFTEQCRKHHMGKKWATLQTTLAEFYKWVSHRLQLSQITISTTNTNIKMLCAIFMMNIHFIRLLPNSIFYVFIQWCNALFWVRGMGKYIF